MRKLLVPIMLLVLAVQPNVAQDDPAVAHARRVLELLRQEKFADVAKEFDPQMTAALPAATLGQVWSTLRSQVGEFKSEISQQVASAGGVTVVTLGCQFERLALNMIVAFNAGDKIAGLQFVPRPPAAAQSAPSPIPSPTGVVEEPFSFGRTEFTLPGTLTLPGGTGRVPAIVLVHGSGPQDRDETVGANKPFRDLAWGLAARGVAVLRYEKRTKQHAQKLAQNATLTVREETVEDAVLAVQALRAHRRVDALRVFIVGHSLGGTVAPRIAKEDTGITGLIIMAGSTRPLQELIIEQAEYLASLAPNPAAQQTGLASLRQLMAKTADPALPLNTPPGELMGIPAAYWKDLNGYKPAAIAATLNIPILILQGERDYQVTMKDFQGWRDGLKGRSNATLKSYPDLNHLFVTGTGKSTPAEYDRPGKVSDAVIEDIAAWVKL